MKRDKLTLWLPTAATLILALGLWMGYTITTNRLKLTAPRTTESSAAGSKLDYTLSLINRAYVDKIDTDTIVENLMHDMMAQLDPHSVYVPAEELKELNEPLEGEFDGIGVVFNMTTDIISGMYCKGNIVLVVVEQGHNSIPMVDDPMYIREMNELKRPITFGIFISPKIKCPLNDCRFHRFCDLKDRHLCSDFSHRQHSVSFVSFLPYSFR